MKENLEQPVVTGKEQGILAINDMIESGLEIQPELIGRLVDLV